MIKKPQRRQPDQTHLKLLHMSGDLHPNPGPATKYPCPVCTCNVTNRGVSYKCTKCHGWVHAKCSGILNASQYRRKKVIGPATPARPHSPSNLQHQLDPPLRLPNRSANLEVFTLNDHFSANGIGNKLTELGVVLELNKVKVIT